MVVNVFGAAAVCGVAEAAAWFGWFMCNAPSYYRVVVINVPLQGRVCYTVRDAVDWLSIPTTRWFTKGSNHSLFVSLLIS
jgi:hypothetical protein